MARAISLGDALLQQHALEADASAGGGDGAAATRGAGADAAAGFCAVVRAAARANADAGGGVDDAMVAAEAGAAGGSVATARSLLAQLSSSEGELFNHVDKSRTRAGYLSCAICDKKFHETNLVEGRHEVKVLVCFHSVCGTCLQTALADHSTDSIHCPLCMSSQNKRTLHEYLPHFELHSMTDREKIAQGAFQCEECITGSRAEAYCEECQMHMCGVCVKQHQRAKATVRHELRSLRLADAAREQNVHRAQYCAIHRTSRYELYCEDCDCLICVQCVVEAHQHHSYKLPSAALIERHKSRIQEVVDKLCAQLFEAQELQTRIRAVVDAAESKASEVRGQIVNAFEQLLQAAEARSSDLKQELLSAASADQRRGLDVAKAECSMALVDIWRTIDFLEKVLSRGTDVEVLQAKGQLFKRHQRQLQQWEALTEEPLPALCREGHSVAAGWRSPGEADRVLQGLLGAFGGVEALPSSPDPSSPSVVLPPPPPPLLPLLPAVLASDAAGRGRRALRRSLGAGDHGGGGSSSARRVRGSSAASPSPSPAAVRSCSNLFRLGGSGGGQEQAAPSGHAAAEAGALPLLPAPVAAAAAAAASAKPVAPRRRSWADLASSDTVDEAEPWLGALAAAWPLAVGGEWWASTTAAEEPAPPAPAAPAPRHVVELSADEEELVDRDSPRDPLRSWYDGDL